MNNSKIIAIVLLTTEHIPEKTLHVFAYIEVKKVLIPLKCPDDGGSVINIFFFFR